MTGRRSAPTIIGRDRELGTVVGPIGPRRSRGRPRHMLVAGEAGIGKSRLVAEASRLATERGMRVLTGCVRQHRGWRRSRTARSWKPFAA